MSDLKDFASFIKHHKLQEFIATDLQVLQSFRLPLFRFLSNLPEKELKELMRATLLRFLAGLETDTAIEVAKESLANWENDSLPGISKNQISLPDIVLGYYAQKASLIQFLPEFTNNVQDVIKIVQQLEEYYQLVQEMAMNVLNRLQAENQKKLLENEEKYRDLFDNATDLIHFVRPDGRILYANNAWQKALGYSQEELQDRYIYDFITPDEMERFKSYRTAVIAGAKNVPAITTTFSKKNGGQIIVEGFLSCKYEGDQPLYTRGILRDVTKRKEIEKKLEFFTEQLLEREENFRNLIHHAPDAIIVINVQSIIQLWNPKAEQLFGWKMEEVIGNSLVDTIIPPEYHEAHLRGIDRLLTTGVSHILNRSIEITAMNKARQQLYVSLTISRSSAGKKNLFIAFLRDISVQKQNAFELEERRKQLERSNEELEQFAWLTSHDLKEPLRKIMTFSDLLLKRHLKELDKDAGGYLEKISNAAHRMNNLIEAILIYSNVSEQQKLFEPVDLNKVVREVIADLEISIKEKNASLSFEQLPVIEAVSYQMQQLFQNLISNAMKYARPDVPPMITISCMDTAGREVKIMVKDNGIGFDNLYAEKIFQVFQRLETSGKYEGTGIGLALCRKIVEAHGGQITAEAKENEGAVFTVLLPLKQKPDKKNPHNMRYEDLKIK